MGTTRLSGLISGLDTDSLISQLVEARKTKVTKKTKEQTKLSWKQETWKGLNTKLKNLQNKFVANMRFASSYSMKKTSTTNPNKVSVITGSSAVEGTQSLKVNALAKTGYLTGGKVTTESGDDATALTKLSDLGYTGGDSTISVTTKEGTKDIAITADSTISDVLTSLKEAGLNANFDAGQQRLFISSKASGASNDFSITSSGGNGQNALMSLGIATDLGSDAKTMKKYTELAAYVGADDATTAANMSTVIAKEVDDKVSAYVKQYTAAKKSLAEQQEKIDELTAKSLKSADEYETDLESAKEAVTNIQTQIDELDSSAADYEDRKKELEESLEAAKQNQTDIETNLADAKTLATAQETVTKLEAEIADIESNVNIHTETTTDEQGNETTVYTADATDATDKLILSVTEANVAKANAAADTIAKYNAGKLATSGATKISGADAEIELNGAIFTGSTNVFAINGLTITAQGVTDPDEEITLTTTNDTDGIYDMVKNFLTEYNSVINEMDKLYNEKKDSDYEPLTEEEKEAMSDKEVEKYEEKAKTGILRNDSTLSTLSSSLTSIMSAGYKVGNKTYYLSDFGIATQSYFDAADNEKHAYHIDGDADDAVSSGNADKLKSMIANDPDTVISFFSAMSKELYTRMTNLSSSVTGTRSYGSFYDDKKMESDYKSYTEKISDLEDRLNDYEDKMYSKFSKMETAMAKMQSATSSLTSMLGG